MYFWRGYIWSLSVCFRMSAELCGLSCRQFTFLSGVTKLLVQRNGSLISGCAVIDIAVDWNRMAGRSVKPLIIFSIGQSIQERFKVVMTIVFIETSLPFLNHAT